MSERYVVLALGRARSPWLRDLARWATSGSLPVELVQAVSAEEAATRLRSGRPFSLLLVDDGVLGLDRELVAQAGDQRCPVAVIATGEAARRWVELGATATLPPGFDAAALRQVLGQVAEPVRDPVGRTSAAPPAAATGGFRGRLVAVTGAGGTGVSTVAAAVAQGLAASPAARGMVCLADLACPGEQAMLHGAPDVVPGLPELLDAHRLGAPARDAVRELAWHVDERGYDLLLGLRRRRDWTLLRSRTVAVALDSLRRSYRSLVVDVGPELDGEAETGSIDVEERNALARATLPTADLVVVVGGPGVKGLHTLVGLLRDLLEHGVPADRVLPVVNRASRRPTQRAEAARAFGDLVRAIGAPGLTALPAPLPLAERRALEVAVRDAAPLPRPWVRPLASAVDALLAARADAGEAPAPSAAPIPVAPGSLGTGAAEGWEAGTA